MLKHLNVRIMEALGSVTQSEWENFKNGCENKVLNITLKKYVENEYYQRRVDAIGKIKNSIQALICVLWKTFNF